MTQAARTLLLALADLVLAMARNPVAAVDVGELERARRAYDAEAGSTPALAPLVQEPADVVLERAREALGVAARTPIGPELYVLGLDIYPSHR